MLGLGGVRAIAWRAAAVTVRVSPGLVTPPKDAVITVVPVASVVARPWVPTALEIVATDAVADAQVTCVVRSAVVPSVYVPVAVNCSVRPLAMLGLGGVRAIDWRVAAVTVSVSPGLVTPPRVAVITVVPVASVVARPWVPTALEIVATDAVADAQVTCVDRSAVVPSL